jgi:hypothetical protein
MNRPNSLEIIDLDHSILIPGVHDEGRSHEKLGSKHELNQNQKFFF